MATLLYKQRTVPRIDSYLPKPTDCNDPLSNIYAGADIDGTDIRLYIWQDTGGGYSWDEMTEQQESYWAKVWDCERKKTFYTKVSAGNKIVDLCFWGSEINMIVIANKVLMNGEGLNFTKQINSDTINFEPGNIVSEGTDCLIIRN